MVFLWYASSKLLKCIKCESDFSWVKDFFQQNGKLMSNNFLFFFYVPLTKILMWKLFYEIIQDMTTKRTKAFRLSVIVETGIYFASIKIYIKVWGTWLDIWYKNYSSKPQFFAFIYDQNNAEFIFMSFRLIYKQEHLTWIWVDMYLTGNGNYCSDQNWNAEIDIILVVLNHFQRFQSSYWSVEKLFITCE